MIKDEITPVDPKRIDELLGTLSCYGDEGRCEEMVNDLLPIAFSELVQSEFFSELDVKKRQNYIELYIMLCRILHGVKDFVGMHPYTIKVSSATSRRPTVVS